MELNRVHDLMENEVRCINRADKGICDRDCRKCELVKDTEELLTAYGVVIKMLEDKMGGCKSE